jgi:peptide/nickel transport system substrate-binding protein
MKKTFLIFVLVLLVMVSLAAQGVKEESAVLNQKPVPTSPIYGNTLTMAVEAEPQHIDPHLSQSNLVTSIVDLCYDYLWRWDYDFAEFVPHIASSWEWVTPTKFQANLRKGVMFHNGREVNASDVVYSVERLKDPKTGSPLAGYLDPVKDIRSIDDYTVVIELNAPWFGLQDIFSRYVPIVPKEAVEKYGDLKTNPVGSGPYVFSQWRPGYEMKFKKFDNYWEEGKPYLDEVVLRFMPEYNTAKNALLSGEIDIINWPDSADIESLKANKNLVLHYYNAFAIMYININTSSGPLANSDVRQAIALATDRNAYNQALYRGMGEKSWSPIPKGQPYYKTTWEVKRDIEEAKRLLTKAGFPNGFEIEILALKGAEEIMGEVLQSDLAQIGINAQVTIAEIPIALDRIFTKEDFDLAVLGDAISPDPDMFVSNYLVPTGPAAGATGRWSNSRVIELTALGKQTVEIDERVPIYKEIYDIVAEENPMIFLAFPVRHPVSNTDVQGWFAWGDIRYDWKEIWLNR